MASDINSMLSPLNSHNYEDMSLFPSVDLGYSQDYAPPPLEVQGSPRADLGSNPTPKPIMARIDRSLIKSKNQRGVKRKMVPSSTITSGEPTSPKVTRLDSVSSNKIDTLAAGLTQLSEAFLEFRREMLEKSISTSIQVPSVDNNVTEEPITSVGKPIIDQLDLDLNNHDGLDQGEPSQDDDDGSSSSSSDSDSSSSSDEDEEIDPLNWEYQAKAIGIESISISHSGINRGITDIPELAFSVTPVTSTRQIRNMGSIVKDSVKSITKIVAADKQVWMKKFIDPRSGNLKSEEFNLKGKMSSVSICDDEGLEMRAFNKGNITLGSGLQGMIPLNKDREFPLCQDVRERLHSLALLEGGILNLAKIALCLCQNNKEGPTNQVIAITAACRASLSSLINKDLCEYANSVKSSRNKVLNDQAVPHEVRSSLLRQDPFQDTLFRTPDAETVQLFNQVKGKQKEDKAAKDSAVLVQALSESLKKPYQSKGRGPPANIKGGHQGLPNKEGQPFRFGLSQITRDFDQGKAKSNISGRSSKNKGHAKHNGKHNHGNPNHHANKNGGKGNNQFGFIKPFQKGKEGGGKPHTD